MMVGFFSFLRKVEMEVWQAVMVEAKMSAAELCLPAKAKAMAQQLRTLMAKA
jgi:hypothetical protein